MLSQIERKLDSKNRIIVPSSLRNCLGTKFYLTLGLDGNAELRNEKEYEKYSKVVKDLDMFDKSARILKRFILGNAVEIFLDSQNRFLLSKNIIDTLSIQKDVIFVPVGSFVELWSKDKLDEIEGKYSTDDISAIAHSFSKKINN